MDTSSTGRRLQRQSSNRLRMHAPSSLKVAHVDSADVAAWKSAIPLLSPLDAASAPRIWDAEQDAAAARKQTAAAAEKKVEAAAAGPTAWTHPAAPFYYEPAPPGAGPAFLLPHCI